MKRLFFLIFIAQAMVAYSQSPAPFINYQGVARAQNGDPITGTIGVELIITQGSTSGSTVLIEHYAVPTNTFGIFNLRIGSDKPVPFAAIDWSNGPYHVTVKIDPLNNANYTLVSQQELVSVPYALYAKEAKNVRNYVAGTNVTIDPPSSGNNYTINAAGGSSGGVDTLVVLPLNHTVTSIGYKHTINIASPVISAPNTPISITSAFPNYLLGYTYPTLALNGSSLTIQQGTYTSSAITLTNGASVPTWTINSGNIVQVNTNALVGIGLTIPNSKLDVTGNTSNIINATTTGTGNVINANTSGSGNGLFSTAVGGAALIGVNSSAIGAAVQANNGGGAESLYAFKTNTQTGTAAKFENLNGSNSSTVVVVKTNSSGMGISVNVGPSNAISASSNGGTPSIFATNTGAGAAIEANNSGGGASLRAYKSSGSGSAADFNNSLAGNTFPVLNINNASNAGGTAVNITHTAGVGINASTSGPGNVANLITSGGGLGLNALAGGNSAINAVNSSSTAATIFASNNGNSHAINAISFGNMASIYSSKNNSTLGGPAGYFENLWNGNPAPVLLTANNSSLINSYALDVVSSGSAPTALQVNNGHIKSIQTNAPTFSTSSVAGGFTTPGSLSFSANSTDVKGSISFTTDATGFSPANSCDVQIKFNKPYTISPVVVVSPTSDLKALSFAVVAINPSTFTVRIYRPNGLSFPITLTATTFSFNYMVIE